MRTGKATTSLIGWWLTTNLVLGLGSSCYCSGFTLPRSAVIATKSRTFTSRNQCLSILVGLAFRDDRNDNNDDASCFIFAANAARVDVRNLLTQRAIQSFMFLLTTVRDPHSVKWIEDFLDTQNQLDFHGTGAGYLERFGGSWDAPLLAMAQEPKNVIIVRAKRSGAGHRGWSRNNPYLPERFVEFEIDVDPVSLASRILSVREQIAREWVTDLDILSDANSQILDSYFAKAKGGRQSEQRQDDDDADNTEQLGAPLAAFDRTAVNILNNHMGFNVGASSPFRKGNFDLLYNLCTQAAVHRVLRDLGQQQEEAAFCWLRDFYIHRVAEFFDGDQRYGRADDFMEELLLTSPSVVYTGTKDRKQMASLADPMGLAERIIEGRREVVAEWKETMKQVPDEHASGIRIVLLGKQTTAWNSEPSTTGGFE
jgi:hypothetical protein